MNPHEEYINGLFHLGLRYTLPALVVADASLDHKGNVRFQLMRENVPTVTWAMVPESH